MHYQQTKQTIKRGQYKIVKLRQSKQGIPKFTYLNDIELLQKGIINAGMKQENGEDIKKNIDFIFIMTQIVQEAFDKPLAFFHLEFVNHV